MKDSDTLELRTPPEGFTGVVNLQLTELIQMLCLARSSLVMKVSSSGGSGMIFVREGQILHAQSGIYEGEAAFYDILQWKDGNFEMVSFVDPGVRSINKSWECLVLETMRLHDEENAEMASIDEMFDGLDRLLPDQIQGEDDGNHPGPAEDSALEDDLILNWNADSNDLSMEVPPRILQVLLVDDSSFFVSRLKRMIESDPDIRVAAVARNGKECLELLVSGKSFDLIVLDNQMPIMQGDTALRHIMIRYPVPVLIVSALHPQSPAKLFEFFQIGAVDYLPKPTAADNADVYGARLRELARGVAEARVSHFRRCRKPVRDLPAKGSEVVNAAVREKVLVVLGAEGAHMDWFRLPLWDLCALRLTIGLLSLTESLLPGFCRLLENWSTVKTVALDRSLTMERGCFYWGNPAPLVNLKLAPSAEALDLEILSPESLDWAGDAARWIDQLSAQAGAALSVYCLSGARVLPRATLENLLQNGGRLMVAPQERVVCTSLVESAEPYLISHPGQVLSVPPENLARVLL